MPPSHGGSLLARAKHITDSIDNFIKRALPWVGIAICVIVAANVASDYGRIHIPGASVPLFWTSLALSAVCIVLLLPPVIRRLPKTGIVAVLALMIALFVAADRETETAFDAYMRTAAGQMEQAAVNAEAEKERAAAAAADRAYRASPQYAADQAAATARQAEEKAAGEEKYGKALDACFSTFGHGIPKLTSQVKDSLENPDAFEYVDMQKIGGSDTLYNVELTFRAQNGFGAIRTASVRAKIKPDDCSVQEVTKIED